MAPPYPFDGMLVFAFLSALLLCGVALRAQMGVLQRFLIPGGLIGGILGLALRQAGLFDWDTVVLEAFAYHFFNLSFISVGLTRNGSADDAGPGRRPLRGAAWLALMQGLTFPLQAVLGGLVVLLLGMIGWELFPTFGFLLPLGFNEGPGQALSIGKVWAAFGFRDGATIGMTFAAAGYICSFLVGVPLVTRGIRQGRATYAPRRLPADVIIGIRSKNAAREAAGHLTLYGGNADTLAFQMAWAGMVYGATYGGVSLLSRWLPSDAAAILWGFFFFFGLAIALAVRKGLQSLGAAHLLDPGIQRRITGWSVDYLVVATVAAIQLPIVWQYAVPVGVIVLVNALATTAVVVWLGRRLTAFPLERTAAIYGTVTGTVSCGLLLLRMCDPDFRTPVALEIALMNVLALPIVGGCTLLVNAPLWWGWSLPGTLAVFAAIFTASLVTLLRRGNWTRGKHRSSDR